MKPRIFMLNGLWFCHDDNRAGWGGSPQQAYFSMVFRSFCIHL